MEPVNILFFLPDEWRRDYLGYLDTVPVKTPNIDRLAERGTAFSRAYCPSPLCGPSRACLAGGHYYNECLVPDNSHNMPLSYQTYYQRLQEKGYEVMGVGKFDLHKGLQYWGEGASGTYRLNEWGFTKGIDCAGKIDAVESFKKNHMAMDPYMKELEKRGYAQIHVKDLLERDYAYDTVATPLPEDLYCDNWIGEKGLDLLNSVKPGNPWHLAVNFTGPHFPMDVTESMQKKWRQVTFPSAIDFPEGDFDRINAVRQNYAAMIENIDRIIGNYIAAVTERGELDKTLIIFSSDHGEMLGDHGRWFKETWYEASVGIPLVISGPGVAKGKQTSSLVMLQDLANTFCDFAGAEPLPGTGSISLRSMLEEKAESIRDEVSSALGNWKMSFDGKWKRIIFLDKQIEYLYDLENDPNELAPTITSGKK